MFESNSVIVRRHLMALQLPGNMGALHSLGHPFLRGSMYVKMFISVCVFKSFSKVIGQYNI
jgi:hypothetical protein